MFSRFLKYIIPPFSFRVYFRRIFYSNLKKVPLNKPLLFVGNHQNSFMDGILVGSYLPQPIHFLMRADMFRKPFARFCLRELNVAPIYRLEEGIENVHKNLETFDGIYDILKRNGNLIVFSEGICVQEKRLQKLRKGTARMAFGAQEKYGLDVHIVPVGINYTYPSKFRKEVMINFHESFSINEFKEDYLSHPAKALLAFNEKLDVSLRKEVIIVEDPANDWVAEELLKMKRNDHILPMLRWRFDTDDRRIAEKKVCDRINHLSKTSPELLDKLTQNVKAYVELLGKNRIQDANLSRTLDYSLLRYLILIAGLPVFIAGYLTNLMPYVIPRFICYKLIKDKRFYSSVYVSSGTVLYLLYFPAILIIASILFGIPGFLSALLVPITGYLVLFYQEIFLERLQHLKFKWKYFRNPEMINNLLNLRKEILKSIEEINMEM